ncbi:MAG: hypothetical protein AAFZ18_09590 [Myxococcota bacterium]
MIHWDEGAEAVTIQWKRPAQYDVFRKGLETGLAQVGEHKASRVVADHSLLNLQDEDEAHFLRQWVPQAGRAGVGRLAVVVARQRYVQIPKSRLTLRLKSGGLTMHYFMNLDEAQIWVKAAKAA